MVWPAFTCILKSPFIPFTFLASFLLLAVNYQYLLLPVDTKKSSVADRRTREVPADDVREAEQVRH